MRLMGQGLLLTVIGMGTVFLSLWALAVLIRLIEGLVGRFERLQGKESAKPALRGAAPEAGEPRAEEDLIPVIAAAVGAYLEAERAQVFLVPVARPDRSRWTLEGRISALSRGEGF